MSEAGELQAEWNSLIRAVYQRRLRLTRLLLEGGAYINESNDRGETPLMVACRTKHVDLQSVSKAKMVKYLLDNKADPNIQDKSGKTALMHACLEKAGPEVVSLLLQSGADPSLQDHSSCSALVYAINSGDRETLKVLLNACRARGKEVIIITTDKSPSGRQKTKQYLNTPPAEFDECHSPVTCTSPSQIELQTSPSPLSASTESKKPVFTFADLDQPRTVDNSSQTVSPARKSSSTKAGFKAARVQRLKSEPWIKSSSSLFHQNKITSLQEKLQDINSEEKLPFKMSGLALSKRFITRHQSIDIKDTAHLLKTCNRSGSRKSSYDELKSQIPHVEDKYKPSGIPVGKDASSGPISFISNLSNIIHKRNTGTNLYSSDSQLTTSPGPGAEGGKLMMVKKKILSPSQSLLSGPREVLEKIPGVPLSRRSPGFLERRGSGALLLDNNAQARPGFLPPLNVNPHPPVPEVTFINRVSGMVSCGPRHLLPAAPPFPRDTKNAKILLRRQSLQTEQIKQLVNF
ncbi:AN34B protein, partial [Turnix velox]|nr:AN34B protein [Turnix velox]